MSVVCPEPHPLRAGGRKAKCVRPIFNSIGGDSMFEKMVIVQKTKQRLLFKE